MQSAYKSFGLLRVFRQIKTLIRLVETFRAIKWICSQPQLAILIAEERDRVFFCLVQLKYFITAHLETQLFEITYRIYSENRLQQSVLKETTCWSKFQSWDTELFWDRLCDEEEMNWSRLSLHVCGFPPMVAPGNHPLRVTCVDITDVNIAQGFARLLSSFRVQSKADTGYSPRPSTLASDFMSHILWTLWTWRQRCGNASYVSDETNVVT